MRMNDETQCMKHGVKCDSCRLNSWKWASCNRVGVFALYLRHTVSSELSELCTAFDMVPFWKVMVPFWKVIVRLLNDTLPFILFLPLGIADQTKLQCFFKQEIWSRKSIVSFWWIKYRPDKSFRIFKAIEYEYERTINRSNKPTVYYKRMIMKMTHRNL